MENPINKKKKKVVYLVTSGNCHRIFRSKESAECFAFEVGGKIFVNYIFK